MLNAKQLNSMSEIGDLISDFCVDNSVENVVFLDRSARPAYIPFKEQWSKNHSDKKRPSIYFLSPKMLEETVVGEEEVDLFRKEHPYLTASDKPTLIFDVCVKDGLTFQNVSELFEKAGFSNVYTMATAVHNDRKQYFQADKILYNNHSLGCHLFGSPLGGNEIGVGRDRLSLLAKPETKDRMKVVQNRSDLYAALKCN